MLNGIDTDGLAGARAAIRAEPAAGIARYGVALDWKQGTQIEAKALPMHVGADKIERNFKWVVDEPPQLLGQSSGPTPQEYLMSGVGACIMVGFVVNAAVKGVALKSLRITMGGSLDLAGFLNLRSDAQVKMTGLTYEIDVDADADDAVLQEIARVAFEFSPNAMSAVHGVSVTGGLKQKTAA
jgi:uncharacterized OsmC-like protein